MNYFKPKIQVLHHNNFDRETISWLLKADIGDLFSIEAISVFKEIKDCVNTTVVIANPDWISDRIPEASFKNLLDSSKSNFIVLSKKNEYNFLNSEKVKIVKFTANLKEVISKIQEFHPISSK